MSFARGVCTAFRVGSSGLLLLAVADVRAQVPRDETAFTQGMANRLTAAMPAAQVIVNGPLTLGVNVSGSEAEFQVNGDRVWAFCARDSDRCSAVMEDYATKIAAAIKQVSAPADASMLRVVLRPAA